MSDESILVYLMRRDLRASDNPVLTRLSTAEHGFTHLLPVYIFPPDQIEVSGLVKDGKMSPYPPARYSLSQRWKCGNLRAKFIAESLWDLRANLENLGSGLVMRVGDFGDVLNSIIHHYAADQQGPQVTAVWMIEDYSPDQQKEEEIVSAICDTHNIKLDLLYDVKYFMHDLQLPEAQAGIDCLPDSFSLFWRTLITEGEKPLDPFPPIARSVLPLFPDHAPLPSQESPFEIPDTLEKLIQKLQSPLQLPMNHLNRPEFRDAAMPRKLPGGESRGQQRIRYIIKRGIVSSYHLLSDDVQLGDGYHGLQSYLALGCITARQVHQELLKLECGTDSGLAQTLGFNRGSSVGTESIRYYLLMLNFIRLSIIKYGNELLNLEGTGIGKNPFKTWKSSVIRDLDRPGQAIENVVTMTQFLMGLTGFGLVDAIMRQLYLTGQVTTRGEEIAMDFFALYAGLDWRYGAEYISSLSTDHDPLFHYYISQNCAGVGPNHESKGSNVSPAEISQQVDPDGAFIRRWMPELRRPLRKKNIFRVSTTASSLSKRFGLASSIMVIHEVPRAMDTSLISEITNTNRAHMENTMALARREHRHIHAADVSTQIIRDGDELEEFGLRLEFADQHTLPVPFRLVEPNELSHGPPPRPQGTSLPSHSSRGTTKAQLTSATRAPAPLAEATVRDGNIALEQINPFGHRPVAALPPPVQFPQMPPAQPSFDPLDIPAFQQSDQSSYTAVLSRSDPQSQSPPLPTPVNEFLPSNQQPTLNESSMPARQLPPLPAAPSPPPPPPPTLSSAIPHLSDAPQVPLPQQDTPRVSIEDFSPPAIMVPIRRNPRRLRPRVAVIPHPALTGFLPVVAEPEIIRYYIGQLRQTRFRGSSNYTFIDLPSLDNNRIHIIRCPRGVVPLRGDPDFDISSESLPSASEYIDLETLDGLIDEIEDDEVAIQGPRVGHSRRGSIFLRPYRGRRQPSRFNFRYR